MSWVFEVRALSLTLLLVSTTSTFAQTIPAEKHPFPPVPFLAPRRSQLTAWQIAEWSAHVTKCVRGYGPTRNLVTVSVTIGPDGMIMGDPEIASPIDSEDFREDVKKVVKRLHQCEPFIVDPFGRDKGTFIQPFNFPPMQFDPEMLAAVEEHFKKCWRRPKTGPDVTVELKYKPNGRFAELPHPLYHENTTAYSRAAAEVISQLGKCPPLEFPQDKYPQVKRLTWTFMTIESAAAHKSKAALQ